MLAIGPVKVPVLGDIRKAIPALLIIGLIITFLSTRRMRQTLYIIQSGTGVSLLIFFLIITIASIVNPPTNGYVYFASYVFGIVSFFVVFGLCSRRISQKKLLLNIVSIVIIVLGLFSSINSLITVLYGKTFIEFSRSFIIDKTTDYRLYDYERGRIYSLAPLELFIVFTYFTFLKTKKKPTRIVILTIFFLGALSLFISNYRGRSIAGAAGVVLIAILMKSSKKSLLIVLLSSLLIGSFVSPTNLVGRLSLKQPKDIDTIFYRLEASKKAIQVGLNNPILGIGIGNFMNYSGSIWTSVGYLTPISYDHPHNGYLLLFAETGFFSTLLLLFFITQQVKKDIVYLRKSKNKDEVILPFIISSWVFILVNSVDWYASNLLIFFFLIRGLIDSWYEKKYTYPTISD